MAEKITGINVEGRVYEFLSGQGVKGACTAPASSWTKPLVLPEGAVLLDGLIMAVTFVNGNSVGFSGTKTIYSSDGENFYYDQAKTDPVTFPPIDNYILEYISGEAYSFSAFPTIVYGNHTLPVRDAKGHITGGEVWNTGDTVICMFMDNMFLMLSAVVSNAITRGDMNPVASNAVAEKISSLNASSVGGSGKYISAISETDGKISATESDLVTMITSSVDLNTMVQVGVYATASDVVGNGCTNVPISSPHTFFLTVSRSGNSTTMQVFTDSFLNRYIRNSYNGGQTWNSWQRVTINNFFGFSSSMLTDPIKTEIRNQFNNTTQFTTFRGETKSSSEGTWWGYRHRNYGCGIFISRGQFVAFYLDSDSFRTKVFMDNI